MLGGRNIGSPTSASFPASPTVTYAAATATLNAAATSASTFASTANVRHTTGSRALETTANDSSHSHSNSTSNLFALPGSTPTISVKQGGAMEHDTSPCGNDYNSNNNNNSSSISGGSGGGVASIGSQRLSMKSLRPIAKTLSSTDLRHHSSSGKTVSRRALRHAKQREQQHLLFSSGRKGEDVVNGGSTRLSEGLEGGKGGKGLHDLSVRAPSHKATSSTMTGAAANGRAKPSTTTASTNSSSSRIAVEKEPMRRGNNRGRGGAAVEAGHGSSSPPTSPPPALPLSLTASRIKSKTKVTPTATGTTSRPLRSTGSSSPAMYPSQDPEHVRRERKSQRTYARRAGRDHKNALAGSPATFPFSNAAVTKAAVGGASSSVPAAAGHGGHCGGSDSDSGDTILVSGTCSAASPTGTSQQRSAGSGMSAGEKADGKVAASVSSLPERPPHTGPSARCRPAVTIIANFPTPSILSPATAPPPTTATTAFPTSAISLLGESTGGAATYAGEQLTYMAAALKPAPASSTGIKRLPNGRTLHSGANIVMASTTTTHTGGASSGYIGAENYAAGTSSSPSTRPGLFIALPPSSRSNVGGDAGGASAEHKTTNGNVSVALPRQQKHQSVREKCEEGSAGSAMVARRGMTRGSRGGRRVLSSGAPASSGDDGGGVNANMNTSAATPSTVATSLAVDVRGSNSRNAPSPRQTQTCVPSSFADAGALSHAAYQHYHPTPQFFHESILSRVMGYCGGGNGSSDIGTRSGCGLSNGTAVNYGYGDSAPHGYGYDFGPDSDDDDFFNSCNNGNSLGGGAGSGTLPTSSASGTLSGPGRPPMCCANCGGAIPVWKLSQRFHHVCLPDAPDAMDSESADARADEVTDDEEKKGGEVTVGNAAQQTKDRVACHEHDASSTFPAAAASEWFGPPASPRICACAAPVVDRDLQAFTAAEILPGLFLGSFADAANARALQHYGISLVVNIAQECPITPEMRENGNRTRYLHLPLKDHSDESIAPYFVQVTYWIHEQLHRRQIYLQRRRLGGTAAGAAAGASVLTPESTPRHADADSWKASGKFRASVSPIHAGPSSRRGEGGDDTYNPWVADSNGDQRTHNATAACVCATEQAKSDPECTSSARSNESDGEKSLSSGGGEEVIFSGSSRPTSLLPSPLPTRTATFPAVAAAAAPCVGGCGGGEVATPTQPTPSSEAQQQKRMHHTAHTTQQRGGRTPSQASITSTSLTSATAANCTAATPALWGSATEGVIDPRDCGGVLVHCRMGVSRSASFVLAYLILYGGQLAMLDEREVERLFAQDAFMRERAAMEAMGGTSTYRTHDELKNTALAASAQTTAPTQALSGTCEGGDEVCASQSCAVAPAACAARVKNVTNIRDGNGIDDDTSAALSARAPTITFDSTNSRSTIPRASATYRRAAKQERPLYRTGHSMGRASPVSTSASRVTLRATATYKGMAPVAESNETDGVQTPRERAARSCPACFDMRLRQRRLKALVTATAASATGLSCAAAPPAVWSSSGANTTTATATTKVSATADATAASRHFGLPAAIHRPGSPGYRYNAMVAAATSTPRAFVATTASDNVVAPASPARSRVFFARFGCSGAADDNSMATAAARGRLASLSSTDSMVSARSTGSSDGNSAVSRIGVSAALSFREAFDYLKSKKADVNPNIGFVLALRELANGGDFSLSSSTM